MSTIEDIEIYIKNLPLAEITAWLNHRFARVDVIKQGKTVHDLKVSNGEIAIPVMIVEKAVGKAWTSIWFKAEGTPWKTDGECARDMNQYHHCRVRFNASPWQQGAEMDEWHQLDEQGSESTIQWPNAG